MSRFRDDEDRPKRVVPLLATVAAVVCAVGICFLVVSEVAGNLRRASDRADADRLKAINRETYLPCESFKLRRDTFAIERTRSTSKSSIEYREAVKVYNEGPGAEEYQKLKRLHTEWLDILWRHPEWSNLLIYGNPPDGTS